MEGIVTALYPGGHAIGITSSDGVEVLIHIGVNLYDKKEQLFDVKVKQGEKVKQGTLMVSLDINKMKSLDLSNDIAVVVTNSCDYMDVMPFNMNQHVTIHDNILVTIPYNSRETLQLKEA